MNILQVTFFNEPEVICLVIPSIAPYCLKDR